LRKVEILDGYQAFGGGGAKGLYGLETRKFSSIVILKNSFGYHDGNIEPVFYLSKRKYFKKGCGFNGLKDYQIDPVVTSHPPIQLIGDL
jgi:hypothetical protein